MKYRAFQHNYHDGSLVNFILGPRRELTLEVDLCPLSNPLTLSARVRFGGIENYDEVAHFFQAIPKPKPADYCVTEIIGLKYLNEGPNSVLIDLDHYGHVIIQSKHVTEL